MNHWQSILTLIVAASTLGVSWFFNRSQARTARAKLKLDLFDRRLAIYNEVTTYMQRQMANHGQVEDVTPFVQAISPAKWLFDESVMRWVEKELLPKVSKLSIARRTARELPAGPEQAEKLRAASETAAANFYDQYRRRDEVFGPFLKLGGV